MTTVALAIYQGQSSEHFHFLRMLSQIRILSLAVYSSPGLIQAWYFTVLFEYLHFLFFFWKKPGTFNHIADIQMV